MEKSVEQKGTGIEEVLRHSEPLSKLQIDQDWFFETFASRPNETGELDPGDREAALKRLESLDEDEQEALKWRPSIGWETERLLLLEQCDFKMRRRIEATSAYQQEESHKLTVLLLRLRDTGFFGVPEADPAINVPGSVRLILSELSQALDDLDSEKVTSEDLRGRVEIISTQGLPDLWPLGEIASALGITKSTVSIYVSQMRAEDAHLPEAQRRIQTPSGGQLTQQEYEKLRAFVKGKVPRPKARRKPSKKRRV